MRTLRSTLNSWSSIDSRLLNSDASGLIDITHKSQNILHDGGGSVSFGARDDAMPSTVAWRRCATLLWLLTWAFPVAAAHDGGLLPVQGRLTAADGSALADGVYTIQFRIYDAPTGGTVLWPGETHQTSVAGGLVSVILGSRTTFADVNFSQVVYLDITIDSNDDGLISAADPPLLPRQAVFPTFFSMSAVRAQIAERADEATHAANADSATRAESATDADHATAADHATTAGTANTAGDADKLGGLAPSAFAAADHTHDFGGGGVVSVHQATITNTVSTSSTGYTDMPGASVTFTPQSPDNPILIMFSCAARGDTSDRVGSIIVHAGGSTISASERTEICNRYWRYQMCINTQHSMTLPASVQTIKIQYKNGPSNDGTPVLNIDKATLTVLEFAAPQ